jgi:hypothetical protein
MLSPRQAGLGFPSKGAGAQREREWSAKIRVRARNVRVKGLEIG